MQPISVAPPPVPQKESAAVGVLPDLGSWCLLLTCPFILGLTSAFQTTCRTIVCPSFKENIYKPDSVHALIQRETVEWVPLCLWVAAVSCLPEAHPHLLLNSLRLPGNCFHKSVSLQVVGRTNERIPTVCSAQSPASSKYSRNVSHCPRYCSPALCFTETSIHTAPCINPLLPGLHLSFSLKRAFLLSLPPEPAPSVH